MPIVDGLTSTKMIRSYEKAHTNIYSPRAALCGRVPVIAVSASLIERDRQKYIDAGFDAWILKPISFDRLNRLMAAVVDTDIRADCLYKPGVWEKGGWFYSEKRSSDAVSTKPSNEAPVSNPSHQTQEAAESENSAAGKEDNQDERSQEQIRRLKAQERGKDKAQVG